MYIGELSRRTGASPKAIRLYESQGLLGEVKRQGSYRIYSNDDIVQIELIRRAQSVGFTLSELAPALKTLSGQPDWPKLARQVIRKRRGIAHDIHKLRQLEVRLVEIEAEFRRCVSDQTLPLPSDAQPCEPSASQAGAARAEKTTMPFVPMGADAEDA